MAGSREAALKARDTNLKKDPLYYHKIGKLSRVPKEKTSFYKDRELARVAGSKGGRISRRVYE